MAQARRTRDLWAGSLLLSTLTGHAMAAAIDGGGTIELPSVERADGQTDDLLRAVMAARAGHAIEDGPSVGSLPNQFTALLADDFDANACATAVRDAWRRAAAAVWRAFVQDVADRGHDVEARWNRQIDHFWDVTWVVTRDGSHDVAFARKHWRTHALPDEPGDKCTLMGDLQELSGYVRSLERPRQDAFWEAIRRRTGAHELIEGERLSAVALVKRLYPRVSREALGWDLHAHVSWPSTSYLAAADWLPRAWAAAPEACERFARALPREARTQGPTPLAGVPDHDFARADGRVYFRERYRTAPNGSGERVPDEEREALAALEAITRVAGDPRPYYAVLLMDGDDLGALLHAGLQRRVLSGALARFTTDAPRLVREAGGTTVYAGGDDLLALLPLSRALPTASRVRERYLELFPGVAASISAAVVFAHDRAPLRQVLTASHRLLDDDAKDANGRDSVAVAVMAASGARLTWTTTWDADDAGEPPLEAVLALAQRLRAPGALPTSSFVYGLRERFGAVTDTQGRLDIGLDGPDDVPALVLAELRRNASRQAVDDASAREIARLVARVAQRRRRVARPDGRGYEHHHDHLALDVSPLLLARFLAASDLEGSPA